MGHSATQSVLNLQILNKRLPANWGRLYDDAAEIMQHAAACKFRYCSK
jgi:hypothetical protein